MRPILFELALPGGLQLGFPAYGTLLVLGMLAAAWASGRHGRTLGLERSDAFDLGVWLLAGGLLGAHLLHIAIEPGFYFSDGFARGLVRAAELWHGGLVYYGGLAAAVPVLWLWGRRRGLPFLDLLDFVAPLGALGLAITRLGCFLNGCCYGVPSAVPWAVTFPAGSLPQQGQVAAGLVAASAPSLPVHPVQLYELVVALALFAGLWWRFPRRRFRGEIVASFGVLYGVWRIVAEMLRADAPGWRPGELALTPNQGLSLVLILVAGFTGGLASRNVRRPPTPERSESR